MNKDQFAYLNMEIKALESERDRDRLKEELANVHRACEVIEKERTDLIRKCDRWKHLAGELAAALEKTLRADMRVLSIVGNMIDLREIGDEFGGYGGRAEETLSHYRAAVEGK